MRQQRNRTRQRPNREPIPEYASCEHCDECTASTLRSVDGHILCENCRDTRHPRRRCAICIQVLPSEIHHVASERQCPSLIICVCLNCHRILSQRQYQWHSAWRSEAHPLRYLVQGVLDVITLWFERSPAAEQCRDLFAMLWHAALYGLAFLQFDALGDLSGLTAWEAL